MGLKEQIRRGAVLLCGLVVLLCCTLPARAADSVEVTIPVSVTGADCTVVLEDARGSQVETLTVEAGTTGELTFLCTGSTEVPYTYTLYVTNEDAGSVTFDRTVYTLTVTLHSTGGELTYTITASSGAAGGSGKLITLSFDNTDTGILLPCSDDPPVRKSIDGLPPVNSTFIFTITRNDDSYPMPEGSTGGKKEMAIIGPGFLELGLITFTKAGIYEYTVTEKNLGEAGYTYDETVYTIHYTVTNQSGQLVAERVFLKDGVEVPYLTAATFTNKYEAPPVPYFPPVAVTPTPEPTPSESPSPEPIESPEPTPSESPAPSEPPEESAPPASPEPSPDYSEDEDDFEHDGPDPYGSGSSEEEEEDEFDEDGKRPNASNPASPPTGDETNLGLWIGAVSVSLTLIVLVLALRHRSLKKELDQEETNE